MEWIEVSEKPPENNGRFSVDLLCFLNNGRWFPGVYIFEHKSFYLLNGCEMNITDDVTPWMIPETPKGE